MRVNITDIKRFAVHDGDGIRTTVFFKGCAMKCVWCHNPETIASYRQLAFYEHKCKNCGQCAKVCKSHTFAQGRHRYERSSCVTCGKCVEICPAEALAVYGREMDTEEICALLKEDRAYYETSGGGITLSGGECLLQSEGCRAILKSMKEQGIHTAVDTCGFVPRAAFDAVMPFTDIFLFDVKACDEEIHQKCTGQSNRVILENLFYLDEHQKQIEVRIPFVPDFNQDQMEGIADILRKLRHLKAVRILPYHNMAVSKYLALGMENTLPPRLPEAEALRKAKAAFAGLAIR